MGKADFSPIADTTRRAEIVALLRRAILTGQLEPGQKLNELRISKRHARAAFAAGGIELGARHYRVMTVMHTLFLFACLAETILLRRPFPGALGWLSLGVVIAAQSLRAWANNVTTFMCSMSSPIR